MNFRILENQDENCNPPSPPNSKYPQRKSNLMEVWIFFFNQETNKICKSSDYRFSEIVELEIVELEF